jgi:hypothetical protein
MDKSISNNFSRLWSIENNNKLTNLRKKSLNLRCNGKHFANKRLMQKKRYRGLPY